MHVESWPVAMVPPRVIGAWRDLAERALEPNPFAEPDLVLAAARHLPDQGTPELLAAFDGAQMAACAPVVRVRRWRRLPWPTVAVWRHDYCFLGTPLVVVDRPAAALDALLRAGTGAASMMTLEWLPTEGKVFDGVMTAAAHRGLRPVVFERFSRAATAPCATAPRLTLSGDRRRRLRRLARQLGAALGGEVEMVERAGDPAVVERFLSLEASGWKGRGGSALACRPGHADFVREVCRAYAEAGRLRLHTLEAGGQIAAVICELRAGDGLFLFKIAHDPEIGRYSPGTQLVVASCESSDARWIDSGAAPGATWLNDLFPEQRTIASLLVSPEGPTGKILASGVGAFVAARNARGGRWHQ